MLPNVSNAVKAYMQPLIFKVITKSMVDYEDKEVSVEIKTKGVRQSLQPQVLSITGDGQRAWKWECLHVLPDVALNIDDVVIFNNTKYRVKEKYDCSEYGYIEYTIAQTFEDEE